MIKTPAKWMFKDASSDSSDEYTSSSDEDVESVDHGIDLSVSKEPRRGLKMRSALLRSFGAVITILRQVERIPRKRAWVPRREFKRREKDTSEPWSVLYTEMIAIRHCLSDKRVRESIELTDCLNSFHRFALTRLTCIRRENDYYIHDLLSKDEAKRVVRVFAELEALASNPCSMEQEIVFDEAISLCSLEVINRMATAALAFPLVRSVRPARSVRKLDFSRLAPADLMWLKSPKAVTDLCHMFGLVPNTVTHLSLARNNISTQFPEWHPFPFPNITTLDIRDNPELLALPLNIYRLPNLKIVKTNGTNVAVTPQTDGRPPPSLTLQSRRITPGARTLIELSAQSILVRDAHLNYVAEVDCGSHTSAWKSSFLPTHLATWLEAAYCCEICCRWFIPGGQGYRNVHTSVSWRVTAVAGDGNVWVSNERSLKKSIRLEGKSCHGCLAKMLSDEDITMITGRPPQTEGRQEGDE